MINNINQYKKEISHILLRLSIRIFFEAGPDCVLVELDSIWKKEDVDCIYNQILMKIVQDILTLQELLTLSSFSLTLLTVSFIDWDGK